MASCGLGAPSIKISNLDLVRTRLGVLQSRFSIRTSTAWTPLNNSGLVISQRSQKAIILCRGSSSEAESAVNLEDGSEETKSSGLTSQLTPNAYEVESLLSEICDTTSIAEFELKLGGFRLYMMRDLAGKIEPTPPPSSTPVTVSLNDEAPKLNGSASMSSLPISKSALLLGQSQTLLDRAADEGLMILQSPKVGFFRRSRTIKGKRAPPSCKEKQIVKEGQVLCYIEQLGGEIPIESDVSGEVIKILREDGGMFVHLSVHFHPCSLIFHFISSYYFCMFHSTEPVGYGDALIAILPSFPGIKKLQ
ncbi:uncharacterized protein LOC100242878 isoform X1 [Vitis vinifera]|uniref:uncharacterized protein LOC100242878 isoform X1 n=1 Tax=Vitis vinifera TaxID=29760 RepID=UPI002882F647|nr:uncharacterized protein LOC100242878 isoform X1 [Vitis vinifera]